MYLSHFGFREAPFSVTPDPRFLYMSERHREALAHLVYGVSEHGGFVQLTGEVGTGKTSVCRCLLEQLPPEVDVALVFNPRLSPVELLATICDELRIAGPPGTTSAKVLVDLLSQRLLEAHGRGRRTVLIVDEAQNLAPGVLEQVRLLTNLETAREKLLQVILIGQPELARLLARPALRQVAQRITARYHLAPLAAAETRAYIRHRLAVAGRPDAPFTEAAMRAVHRRSRGVPRLINAICDRALLGAYARGRGRVDARTVRRAAREIAGGGRGGARAWPRVGAAGLAVAACGAAVVLVTPGQLGRQAERAAATRAGAVGEPQVVPAAIDAASAVARGPGPAVRLPELLRDPGLPASRRDALATVLARWGAPPGAAAECAAAGAAELDCLPGVGTWRKLRRLDLPAVLELTAPDGARRYAALTGLSASHATLRFGDLAVTTPLSDVDQVWEGSFLVVWRPPGVRLPIRPGDAGAPVAWLRARLAPLDHEAAVGAPTYDEALRTRVAAFQRARGLIPDGIVGRETAMVILAAGPEAGVPRLSAGVPDAGPPDEARLSSRAE